jgi:hypothetical protein
MKKEIFQENKARWEVFEWIGQHSVQGHLGGRCSDCGTWYRLPSSVSIESR